MDKITVALDRLYVILRERMLFATLAEKFDIIPRYTSDVAEVNGSESDTT